MKRGEITGGLERKVLAMVFLDPSLRTRSSMETAMFLHGGHALVLEPGKGSWALETEPGAVMDGATVEHVTEAARVLARYADALAVRAFPKGTDWAVEREDRLIRDFARFSDKPVINLESTRRHPCQALADAMTLRERLGETRGKKFVLAWAWHPKALPTAVPASAALAAACRRAVPPLSYAPLNLGRRFSRKANVPSIRSSVPNNTDCPRRSQSAPAPGPKLTPALIAILASLTATGPWRMILFASSTAAGSV